MGALAGRDAGLVETDRGRSTATAPREPCAILGPVRERVIVFGGSGEGSLLNDIWELPLTGEPVWQPMVA